MINAISKSSLGSNSYFWERLYKYALIGGLGSRSGILADQLEIASNGGWKDFGAKNNNLGINAGSPLEFSLRSTGSGVNIATLVGTGAMDSNRRFRLGVNAASVLESLLSNGRLSNFSTLQSPIELWLSRQESCYGKFGSFLGLRVDENTWKINLYVDLFAHSSSEKSKASWQSLIKLCGLDSYFPEAVTSLHEIAKPSMGCIICDSKGDIHHRLYWRIHSNYPSVMNTLYRFLYLDEGLCEALNDINRQVSNNYFPKRQVSGFVHSTSYSDRVNTNFGFYSTSPSQWADTDKKKQQVYQLWQMFGGDPLRLSRVWQLASGQSPNKYQPALTIFGVDVSEAKVSGLSAYFSLQNRLSEIQRNHKSMSGEYL